MGLFDIVRYKDACPLCGGEITDFQTKDGDPCLKTVNPEDVTYFYGQCEKCDKWFDYHVKALTWKITRKMEV